MITLTVIGILGQNWQRSCVLIYGSFTAFNRWFSVFGRAPTDEADDEPTFGRVSGYNDEKEPDGDDEPFFNHLP